MAGEVHRRVRLGARPARREHDSGMLSWRAVWKEPIGVVGAIVPWNYPFEVTLNKLGPVLATGNTVILKPAPDTPWNATRIGRLVAEQTDFPRRRRQRRDVVRPPRSARSSVSTRVVDLISFTGSTATGSGSWRRAPPRSSRLFLELGGKSADDRARRRRLRGQAVPGGWMVCIHGGQGCAMLTRMLLPRVALRRGDRAHRAPAIGSVPYGDPTATP